MWNHYGAEASFGAAENSATRERAGAAKEIWSHGAIQDFRILGEFGSLEESAVVRLGVE